MREICGKAAQIYTPIHKQKGNARILKAGNLRGKYLAAAFSAVRLLFLASPLEGFFRTHSYNRASL